MEQAGIVLNVAQRFWYFEDEPKVKYDFAKPSDGSQIFAMDIAGAHVVTSYQQSPSTKALNEYSNFLRYIDKCGENATDADSPETCPETNYGPVAKGKRSHQNDYSPHAVQDILEVRYRLDK